MKIVLVSHVTDGVSAEATVFQEGANLPEFKLRLADPADALMFMDETEARTELHASLLELHERKLVQIEREAQRALEASERLREAAELAVADTVPANRETLPDTAEEITKVEPASRVRRKSKDAVVGVDASQPGNEVVLPSEPTDLVPSGEPAASPVEAVVTPKA